MPLQAVKPLLRKAVRYAYVTRNGFSQQGRALPVGVTEKREEEKPTLRAQPPVRDGQGSEGEQIQELR